MGFYMKLREAKEILKQNDYLMESTFDGIYSADTFSAIFNMPEETFIEFIKLCKQIRKVKQKYKEEYAYTFAANGELGEKFVDMIKSNR